MTNDARGYIDSIINYNINAYETIYHVGLIEGVQIVKDLVDDMIAEGNDAGEDITKLIYLSEATRLFMEKITNPDEPIAENESDSADTEEPDIPSEQAPVEEYPSSDQVPTEPVEQGADDVGIAVSEDDNVVVKEFSVSAGLDDVHPTGKLIHLEDGSVVEVAEIPDENVTIEEVPIDGVPVDGTVVSETPLEEVHEDETDASEVSVEDVKDE